MNSEYVADFASEQAADIVGIRIWEIENKDVARPSAEKLSLIAAALETTTDYLLGTEAVTQVDAADTAFFRRYRDMDPKAKEKLREMLKILDDKDP